MSAKKVILTSTGLKKVKEELRRLLEEEKPVISREINQALAEGGSDDNPVYDSARERLEQMERRVSELEVIIKTAQVSDEPAADGTAQVGSRVTVEVEGESDTYTLVGSIEASPAEGKISHESPVGRAMLGKKAGQSFQVKTPYNVVSYKVVRIE